MGDPHPPMPYAPPYTTPTKSNSMPLLYYGLIVIGTAALMLVIYNLIIIRWCSYTRPGSSPEGIAPSLRLPHLGPGGASTRSSDNPNAHLISSFKYKKEGSSTRVMIGAYNEYECAVCLSVFEEDEELKQLPRCKHSFHAPCIDMWLYSHLDCPLCRSPVDPPPFLHRSVAAPARLPTGNSRTSGEGLLATVSV